MVDGLYSEAMKIESFKDLVVWQKAMDLTEMVYLTTSSLPAKETYGLASQMQRSAVSIASNIAEGSKRSSRADFRQFCLIALGSGAELETQLLLVKRLYPKLDVNQAINEVIVIQKMLTSLAKKLKTPLS